MTTIHHEHHKHENIGWLRASVLGANDGILSTASLLTGVAAGQADHHQILLAGVAGLIAGALSMAAGEYVSVSSQADTQRADLETEKRELAKNPYSELRELAGIYEQRGLEPALAEQVAGQLMAHDALGAHARDELGLTEMAAARPIQAALASAAAFATGAIVPLAAAAFTPPVWILPGIFGSAIILLALLGALAAQAGGAAPGIGALRVTFWGAISMLVTTGVGTLVGHVGL
ncbi:VIT1/CCC1 transporter family protein [Acidithiobacillus sulfuriphilus]|uniref:VIT1/CCC1 transporter family protein n=1 Tax=Acidithiobacillus sulfuriphilus TaxID=1867749 RepID=UPI003F634204